MENGTEIFRFDELNLYTPSPFEFAGQFIEGRQYQLTVASYALPYNDGYLEWDFSLTTAPAVPVPAAFWLFGSGLLALAGFVKRKL